MDLAELALLREPRLAAAVRSEPAHGDPLRRSAALRASGFSALEATLILTQARLRERAATKFGPLADGMLLTPAGLEQSTRLPVAAQHARRFRAAGATSVADLGCGIGGDALALAEAGLRVLAVERDPVTAAIAAANLERYPSVTVREGDAEQVDPASFDAAWVDPARRTAGHTDTRRVGQDDYSPSLSFAIALGERVPVGVKLGPGFPRQLLPPEAGVQWTGHGGETVETVLWFGALGIPGARSAVLVEDDGVHELSAPGDTADEPPGPLGGVLLEPAGAVLRARLVGDLARATGSRPVAAGIGYLTGDGVPDSPFVTAFAIEAVLPLDRSAIRRELRARGIGRLEIKKRGVDLDPAAFRRSLALRGDAGAVLIATRTEQRRVALLCRRLD